MSSNNRMNPSIQKTEVGIKKLESLTVYPLSIWAQGELSEMITAAMQAFFDPDKKAAVEKEIGREASDDLPAQMSDVEMVSFFIDLIKQNLKHLLSMATDADTEKKAVDLLKKITNDQATEIATLIWEQNYENSIKNALSLFNRVKDHLIQSMQNDSLKRPSQPSSKDTPSTGSNTSSGTPSKKAG